MRISLPFRSGSITTQIVILAIGPVVMVCLFLVAYEVIMRDGGYISHEKAESLRIETAVRAVQSVTDLNVRASVVDAFSKSGMKIELVPAQELKMHLPPVEASDTALVVARRLQPNYKVAIQSATSGSLRDVVVVGLDESQALVVQPKSPPPFSYISVPLHLILKASLAIIPIVALLSAYALYIIARPLMLFASTALALTPDDGPERPFDETGAYEISTLARALNNMRSRIHKMINDRTRMLRAISHDLRTPLTRLRLRAERSSQPDLRDAMLRDIADINDMVEETLTYLRKDVSTEFLIRADLASLVDTVCVDFADVGFSVSYRGPDRLAYDCKPHGLARAIANLVDNATKYAAEIVVSLELLMDGSVRIDVADNGPGLPEDLRAKVLEPFFKADDARTRSGFGLGLSIVSDIVGEHLGQLELLGREPHGLIVRITLPAVPQRGPVAVPRAVTRSARAVANSAPEATPKYT